MLADVYEFSVSNLGWDFLKFRVKPAVCTFTALDMDIWGVVEYVEIDYRLKENGRLKTVRVPIGQSKKGYSDLIFKISKILLKHDKDYRVDDNVWTVFKKAFTNAHMHFVTKNRNMGNILLNSNSEFIGVDTLPIEAMVKEANRSNIIIEVPFKVIMHDSFETNAKLSINFDLSGPRKYGTSGYIGDISTKANLEWYMNNSLVMASPYRPGADDEEVATTLPAARRAFIDLCNLVPDFGLDTFCKILHGIRRAFWATVKSVNKFNYHVDQICQDKNKSSEFVVSFGLGGFIHFNFHEHAGVKACDVCLHNSVCGEPTFTENHHFDTTKSERLFEKKDIEHIVQEFLNLTDYSPEKNFDICEIQFIEWLTKDIEEYWKKHLQQPFLDAIFKPKTIEAEVNILLKPSVENVNLTFNCTNKEKEKEAEPENRSPLSDDWIRHQFNELDRRLKDVEGQTKGVNRSCSKLHKAFEDLKNEMVKLYRGRESEFKLIEETIERLERAVFPEMYNRNPFEHWKFNISLNPKQEEDD